MGPKNGLQKIGRNRFSTIRECSILKPYLFDGQNSMKFKCLYVFAAICLNSMSIPVNGYIYIHVYAYVYICIYIYTHKSQYCKKLFFFNVHDSAPAPCLRCAKKVSVHGCCARSTNSMTRPDFMDIPRMEPCDLLEQRQHGD